jgi:hypothetical protein
MNYGISPDQAGQIVDRLANARNNPITAPSEATMPSNGQFFKMSEMAAPVDFMNDPRYQPIQSGQQMYVPTIEQPQVQGDKFSQLGVIGDFFRLIEQGGGVRPNGQLNNPNNISK